MMMNNKGFSKKVTLIIILMILVIVLGAGLFVYRGFLDKLSSPTQKDETVGFTIEDGETMNTVLNHLHQQGLIQDVKTAKLYVKLFQKNTYFAGNFILNTNMSVQEIIDVISNVDNASRKQVTLTITPGNWAKDIANKIGEITNLDSDEIFAKWNDVAFVDGLIQKYECLTEDIYNSKHCYLEGYLIPETYYIYEVSTIEQVTERILDQTEAVYKKYAEQIKASDLTVHQVFTLSSIVMFEANGYEDMQKVASVFYNRLGKDMKLQSSVTVCYALYNYDNWTECETKVYTEASKNEYNTYVYAGLPVGPISNASESAIKATLNPAETDYLYFIGDLSTGKTIFAKTYAEHQANIKKYLKGKY